MAKGNGTESLLTGTNPYLYVKDRPTMDVDSTGASDGEFERQLREWANYISRLRQRLLAAKEEGRLELIENYENQIKSALQRIQQMEPTVQPPPSKWIEVPLRLLKFPFIILSPVLRYVPGGPAYGQDEELKAEIGMPPAREIRRLGGSETKRKVTQGACMPLEAQTGPVG